MSSIPIFGDSLYSFNRSLVDVTEQNEPARGQTAIAVDNGGPASLELCFTSLFENRVTGPLLFRFSEFTTLLGQGALFDVFGYNQIETGPSLGSPVLSEVLSHYSAIAIKKPRASIYQSGEVSINETAVYRGIGLDIHLEAMFREIEVLSYDPCRRHPNIVNLISWGLNLDDLENAKAMYRVPYLVLEKGLCTLEGLLGSQQSPTFPLLQNLCVDVGRGLRALHYEHLAHGDLKPRNVLIFRTHKSNTGLVAKLCDFGLTISTFSYGKDRSRRENRYTGTPGWRAPEVMQQDIHPLDIKDFHFCDIFSLGALIYSAFVFRGLPFLSDDQERQGLDFEEVFSTLSAPQIGLYKTQGLLNNVALAIIGCTAPEATDRDPDAWMYLETIPGEPFELRENRGPIRELNLYKNKYPSLRLKEPLTGRDSFWLRGGASIDAVYKDVGKIHRHFLRQDGVIFKKEPPNEISASLGLVIKVLGLRDRVKACGAESLIETVSSQNKGIYSTILHRALEGDLAVQAICEQLFLTADNPFALCGFGSRPGIDYHTRLKWLCNGILTGSLPALHYVRNRSYHKGVDKVAASVEKLVAGLGLPSQQKSWEKTYEEDVGLPATFAFNHFRALGGYNNHYQHSRARLLPLKHNLIDLNEGDNCWSFKELTLNNQTKIFMSPGSLLSDIRKTLKRLHSHGKLRGLELVGGEGDSIIHCLAAQAEGHIILNSGCGGVYKPQFDENHPLVWILRNVAVDIDKRNDRGETALWQACAAGHALTAVAFLRAGADPSVANTYGVTPLHWLFNFHNHEIDLVVATLKEQRITNFDHKAIRSMPSFHYPFEWPTGTPLHWAVYAANYHATFALLQLGADINITSRLEDGRLVTPLDLACRRLQISLVRLLLRYGADVRNSLEWIVENDRNPLWMSNFLSATPIEERNNAFAIVTTLLRPFDLDTESIASPFPKHTMEECLPLDVFENVIQVAFSKKSFIALHALARARSLLRLCCWSKSQATILKKCVDTSAPMPILHCFSQGEIGRFELSLRDGAGAGLFHYVAGHNSTHRIFEKQFWYMLETSGHISDILPGTQSTPFSLILQNTTHDQQHFVVSVCKELMENQKYRDSCPRTYYYLTGMLATEEIPENVNLTALHHAVLARNLTAIEILVKNGHAVNPTSMDGQTPLDLARSTQRASDLEVITKLKSFGGRSGKSANGQGWTKHRVGSHLFYVHEKTRSLTTIRPSIEPWNERILPFFWKKANRVQEYILDTQRIFPANDFFPTVMVQFPFYCSGSSPFPVLNEVNIEHFNILSEEKNDYNATVQLIKGEKYYQSHMQNLESIYQKYRATPVIVQTQQAKAPVATKPYEVNLPICWYPNDHLVVPFYTSGQYNDMHGFDHVHEQTALQESLWQTMSKKTENDKRTKGSSFTAPSFDRNITLYLNDFTQRPPVIPARRRLQS